MSNSKLLLSALLVVGLTGLSGCAPVRYPRYYVLNPPATVPAGSQKEPLLGSVAVEQLEAPAILRGGPIVYKETQERLGFYAYERWGIDPRRTITAALIQHLESRGIFASVNLSDGHGSPDCLLTGTILHLEEIDEQADVSIEVGLSARLVDVHTGAMLWQGVSSGKAKIGQRSVAGVVAGMSREVGIEVESLISSMQNQIASTLRVRAAKP